MSNSARKLLVDTLLLILVLSLMAVFFTENVFHEWTGIVLIAALILHNVLAPSWTSHFTNVKQPAAILRTAANVLVLFAAGCTLASGILISESVFPHIPHVSGPTTRALHTASAYWFLILSGIHLGTHWKMTTARLSMLTGVSIQTQAGRAMCHFSALLISVAGAASFIRWDAMDKLLMNSTYGFPPEGDGLILGSIEHLLILVLFLNLARLIVASLERRAKPL